jgi:hypothetical protein
MKVRRKGECLYILNSGTTLNAWLQNKDAEKEQFLQVKGVQRHGESVR